MNSQGDIIHELIKKTSETSPGVLHVFQTTLLSTQPTAPPLSCYSEKVRREEVIKEIKAG